jgi:hypothetical protein
MMTRWKLGIVLCFATIFLCALIHVATFFAEVPWLSVLAPFVLLGGAILCASPPIGWRNPPEPRGKVAVVGWIFLVYAVLLCVHLYRSTGGATNVAIVNGQYFFMDKDSVIRVITQMEYKKFPTQVVRVVSAWMGMMATFCLSSLLNVQLKDRRLPGE